MQHPGEVFNFAIRFPHFANVTFSDLMFVNSDVVQVQTAWQPPPCGLIKVNVHAALLSNGHVVGLGMLAPNNFGQVVSWKHDVLYQPFSPEVAEVVALRTAVQWALKKEWPEVIVEVDCLALVTCFYNNTPYHSLISPMLQDLLLIAASFSRFTLQFARRSGNEVAYSLARCAR